MNTVRNLASWGDRVQTRLDTYEDLVRKLPIAATSPGGWVTVRRDESGNVCVNLRPRTLARINDYELTIELQSALTNAYHAYRQECRQLRRRVFGSDFEEIHAGAVQWER